MNEKHMDGQSQRVWWQNSRSPEDYAKQHDLGIIWVRMYDTGGRETKYRKNVSLLRHGDIVLHYAAEQGAICAISVVQAEHAGKPVPKPYKSKPKPNDDQGYLVKVEYFDLPQPIERDAIQKVVPASVRYSEEGPFKRDDTILGGFLFPLSSNFMEQFKTEFRQHLKGTPLG